LDGDICNWNQIYKFQSSNNTVEKNKRTGGKEPTVNKSGMNLYVLLYCAPCIPMDKQQYMLHWDWEHANSVQELPGLECLIDAQISMKDS